MGAALGDGVGLSTGAGLLGVAQLHSAGDDGCTNTDGSEVNEPADAAAVCVAGLPAVPVDVELAAGAGLAPTDCEGVALAPG